MNLQENISRIKEVMGILNEEMPDDLRNLGNVDWMWRNEEAKEHVTYTMETKLKVPSKYIPVIYDFFPSFNKDPFFILLLTDINKGSLSQKTVDYFKSYFINGLHKASKNKIVLDTIKNGLRPGAISMAKKGIFKPIINRYIDEYIKSFTDLYLVKGLLKSVNDYANETDKRILANSKKVINHLSSLIANDGKLKNDVHNFIHSFISKF